MARTRRIVRPIHAGSSSRPQQPADDSEGSEQYSWVDSNVLDASSVVSEDDNTTYVASLPESPCFDLIRPTLSDRVSDRRRSNSTDDWFYMEHNFQSSSCYYVLRSQLHPEQERIMQMFEQVTQRESISCRELIDATGDELIALLDSMAEGNMMAELRCTRRELARQNAAIPPPAQPTPTPTPKLDIAGGSIFEQVAAKVLVPQGTSPSDPIVDQPVAEVPKQKEIQAARQEGVNQDQPVFDPLDKAKRSDLEPTKLSGEAAITERRSKQKRDERSSSEKAINLGSQPKQQHTEIKATRRLLQVTSIIRHMENSYVPLLKRSEEERKASLDQVKILSERNQKLEEASTQLVDELKRGNESLKTEGLAVKEKEELKTKYEGVRQQDAQKLKTDLESTQAKLEETLKDLEENKTARVNLEVELAKSFATLQEAKSEVEGFKKKYDNVLLNMGSESYENTIQQLKILNPDLVGPIPFIPIDEAGDTEKKAGERIYPSSSNQQAPPQDEEVESKDRTIII
ncbi:RNA polymerase Rpb1 C-terminal repeat domain-containing protein [Sesbania bispinosa]|nr:RNA polymerase Rpb1 C-terminal repeat domain-containing protein [Sesbania bispinosa]